MTEHKLDERISAGSYTYFDGIITFAVWRQEDRVSIGRYCSLARDCVLFGGGNHYTDRATTYPFHAFGAGGARAYRLEEWEAPNKPTVIGHDVWLGHGVRVMPGARIGHGCVIGAGAVVAGSIPAYSVAAGNPAVVVRQRFADPVVERLLEMSWWDWPTNRVLANLDVLLSAPETWPTNLQLAETRLDDNSRFPSMRPNLRARAARRIRLLLER